MQIEKLEENKIRVILTTADLLNMNIDINSLGQESVELNKFLFNIMERIKEETDFNPYGGQVLMEAMPMGDDGISIMVSKVQGDAIKLSKEKFKKIRAVRIKECERKPLKDTNNRITDTYYIENFDDVCSALEALDYNTLLTGALYKIDNQYAYLAVRSKRTVKGITVLSEFADRKSYYPLQDVYIREHGELIAKGRRLVDMAKGIRNLNN